MERIGQMSETNQSEAAERSLASPAPAQPPRTPSPAQQLDAPSSKTQKLQEENEVLKKMLEELYTQEGIKNQLKEEESQL
jgi:hypothetical protein